MKGMVFTNFFEMVENTFSMDMVDAIIDRSKVPSGGVYTAVGTYPHQEIVALVVALSEESKIPVPELLEVYGKYLFTRLTKSFPEIMRGSEGVLHFLSELDGHIHVEVRKLYPDAELPRFTFERKDESHVEMVYHSSRHMETLALGLMKGCCEYFNESIDIQLEPRENGDVLFRLSKINTQ